ncbi:MAG TPA: branched-chain amino acid ABC transporter permease [Atribacterota bacterium]|nr:branched-chain amino acid ABC transporter permease [Atribacterota bacterium]
MMKKQNSKIFTILALIVLGILVYLAQSYLDAYKLRILNLSAIYITLGVSLNLIYGFTGQFSLGHAGFMAIGAYVTALLVLPPYYKEMIFIIEPLAWPFSVMHTPFIIALFFSGLITAIAALLIGLPVLRLKGDYLGIATLGFAEIIRIVANNIPHITNGALGIKGIPEFTNLWWTMGVAVFTIYIIKGLINSSYGRALMAIRENEIAAEVVGINLTYHKVMSFTIGGFFAGVGGGLFACLLTTIDPKAFMFLMTFNILIVVVLGGFGSITGTVIAAFLFNIFLEYLRPIEAGFNIGPIEIPGIPGLRMVTFAALLLIVILYKQKGLLGGVEFSWEGFFQFFSRLFSNKNSSEGSAT